MIPISRYRPNSSSSMAAVSRAPVNRRRPLKADHSIKIPAQSGLDKSTSLAKQDTQGTGSTLVSNRKRRTPSPYINRPNVVSPKRHINKRLSRPSVSPPTERRSVDKALRFTSPFCSSYTLHKTLLKGVDCIISDEAEASPIDITDISLDTSIPPQVSMEDSKPALYGTPSFRPYNLVDEAYLSPIIVHTQNDQQSISATNAHQDIQPQIRGRTSKRPRRSSTLSDKLGSLKDNAMSAMATLKRRFSAERPTEQKHGNTGKTSTQSSSAGGLSNAQSAAPRRRSKSPLIRWCSKGLDQSDIDYQSFTKRQFCTIGKIMAFHQDGTQTVLLQRPADCKVPCFITNPPQNGLLISDLGPSYLYPHYTGLVNVVDDIVEINNEPCGGLSVDQVYKLLQSKSITVRIRSNLKWRQMEMKIQLYS